MMHYLFFLTIIIGIYCSCASKTQTKSNEIHNGKLIYNTYCISCHGILGDAEINGAKNLIISTIPTMEISDRIANGKGTMKAYSKLLTEEQIAALVEYVITMRKKQ